MVRVWISRTISIGGTYSCGVQCTCFSLLVPAVTTSTGMRFPQILAAGQVAFIILATVRCGIETYLGARKIAAISLQIKDMPSRTLEHNRSDLCRLTKSIVICISRKQEEGRTGLRANHCITVAAVLQQRSTLKGFAVVDVIIRAIVGGPWNAGLHRWIGTKVVRLTVQWIREISFISAT